MLYFSRLLCKLGLEHVKFHAIRHTFATRAIENGIDVSTVSGILGHADVTTTTHFYVRPREKAMNRVMQSITPVIQPPAQSAPSALRRGSSDIPKLMITDILTPQNKACQTERIFSVWHAP